MSLELEQRMEALHKRIVLERLRKFNSCHVPSGSAGGQFCETKGGGSHYIPIGEATAQLKGKPTGTRIPAVLSDGTRGEVVATSRFSHRFVKDGEGTAPKPQVVSTPKPAAPASFTPKPTISVPPTPKTIATGPTSVASGTTKVVSGSGVSDNYTKSIEKRIASIPDEYRIVPSQVIRVTATPVLVAGGTRSANGVFRPETGTGRGSIDVGVRVGTGTSTSSRGAGQVAETAYHEYGHAVDFHLGKGNGFRSDRADFREVFNSELAKAGKSINSQFWGTHHREAFAELYKVASGGRITTIGSRSTLLQRFPGSISKIKELVTGRTGD